MPTILYQSARNTENFSDLDFKISFSKSEFFHLTLLRLYFHKTFKACSIIFEREGFPVSHLSGRLFFLTPSHAACVQNISATIELLVSLGFLINEQKSVLFPPKSCRFLGLIFNLETALHFYTVGQKKQPFTINSLFFKLTLAGFDVLLATSDL